MKSFTVLASSVSELAGGGGDQNDPLSHKKYPDPLRLRQLNFWCERGTM